MDHQEKKNLSTTNTAYTGKFCKEIGDIRMANSVPVVFTAQWVPPRRGRSVRPLIGKWGGVPKRGGKRGKGGGGTDGVTRPKRVLCPPSSSLCIAAAGWEKVWKGGKRGGVVKGKVFRR